MENLFTPVRLGGITLPNRIAMSAMTRTRARDDGVPTDLMRDYYVQRASAGLIVTECTQVSDEGHGVIRCPGIHRQDQIDGWRRITDAVHAAGGRIVLQIWHCGRAAHPEMRGGDLPVGPSPIAAAGEFFLPRGRVEFPVPRKIAATEIAGILDTFAQATRNARAAGFDGVELHGANGYLQNQFLDSVSNQRNDAYGGSIEKRARLMLETVQAMIGAWDAQHVGVRLSPAIRMYGMSVHGVLDTYAYLIQKLDRLRPAYLCLLEPNAKDAEKGVEIQRVAQTFRPMTSVPIISNTGYDKSKANAAIAEGHADVIAFGVPFIANPDLVSRLRSDAPLNPPKPALFYGEGPEGYTDYPFLPASH